KRSAPGMVQRRAWRDVSRMRPSALSGLPGYRKAATLARVAALAWRVALLLLPAGAGLQRARLLQVLGDVFAGGGQVLAHVLAGGRGNQLLVQRLQRLGVALHHGVDIGLAVGLAIELVQRGALLFALLALGLGVLGLLVRAEGAGLGAVLGVLVDHQPRVIGSRAGNALGQGLFARGDLMLVDRVEHAQRCRLFRRSLAVAEGRIGGARRLGRRIGRGGIRHARSHVGV